MGKIHKFATMLDEAVATANGVAFDVSDYKNVTIAMVGTDTAVFTLKVKGSIQKTQPTLTAAASLSNIYGYIDILDLEDGSSIDGDTGVAFAANDIRQFEINTENLQWVGIQVAAFTSGKASVLLSATND